MNEKIETVFNLPVYYKFGILIGSLILVVGVYWLMFYSPLDKQVSELRERISGPQGLHVKISEREGIARNLQTYRARVEVLDEELRKALMELPDKREIDMLLSRVSDKARDAGLEIALFRPEPEQKRDFYAAVPVQIEVGGTYHQVAVFFDEVGRMERIVNLEKIFMRDPVFKDSGPVIKTGVSATAFRFLDEAERPSEEDAKTRGRRRSR